MGIGIFTLIVFNVFLAIGLVVLWLRQMRPPKEDPRLSRGLQLLQSKISVIEDLSDRTDAQVKQLTQILDERGKILQTKMLQAEETIRKIEHSMQRSLNVAEIFQDKIPHEEIIERNQRSKYVLAAKMANEGHNIEEIAAEVDLPKSEIELIAKVNREELTYNPELLPDWAKLKPQMKQELEARLVEKVFNAPQADFSSMQIVQQNFKDAVKHAEDEELKEAARIQEQIEKMESLKQKAIHMSQSAAQLTQQVANSAAQMTQQVAQSAANITQSAAQATQGAVANAATEVVKAAKPLVSRVQFPRISVDRSKLPQTIKDEI